MEIALKLTEGMAFAADIGGHKVVVDSGAAFGGRDQGPTPKQMLLVALGTCTSMDIVSILRKMKQPFTDFTVTVSGELRDEHPRIFEQLEVRIAVEGEVNAKKLWKAVRLSRDQYCGVAAMLRPTVKEAYVVVLNGAEVAEPG